MADALLAWLVTRPALQTLGISFMIGCVGYLLVPFWQLWRARRLGWDLFDLLSTAAFVAVIAGAALALNVYDSPPRLVMGVVAAVIGYSAAYATLHIRAGSVTRRR